MSDPRIRNLVRQAHKNVENGKRTAAIEQYRQILEEAPATADAWAGLGNALSNPTEREAAYQRALELEADNELARTGLANLHHPPVPEPKPEPAENHPALTPLPENKSLTCYRHPDKETALRCNMCGNPICIKCAKRTSVGYRCPDCLNQIQAVYFTAENSDYVIAAVVSLFLSFIAGGLLTFLTTFSFFWLFIIFFIGGAGGSLVARVTSYAIGRRRGRYIPHLVATAVVMGALIPSLCLSGLFLVGLFLGGDNGLAWVALMPIVGPGLYAAIAASSAYYWLKV
jgi:hypothetical protein